MLNLRQKITHYLIEHELQSLYLMAPIFFGLGIIYYFSLPVEPLLIEWLPALVLAIGLTIIARKIKKFSLTFIFITLFIAGFNAGIIRTITVKSPVIETDGKPIWVRAKLEDIEKSGKFARLTLTNLDLWQPNIKKFPPENTPYRIRITVRTKIDEDIRIGNMVAFKAILQPPQAHPVFPGGYDFAKVAYFRQIGAIGFAISPIKLFKETKPSKIERFQDYYYRKVHGAIKDSDLAGMIIAQITADRFEISDELKEKVRNAGLSHLLAISGMNMTVVMVWFFILTRAVLSFFPRIALTYDTKKIGCFVAIFLGFTYLMVTGMPVSAIRAFFMTLILFIAILFDRNSFSLHTVAVVALLILLVMPEQILSPSFQLSFAAVIGLIGFYELYTKYIGGDKTRDKSFIHRIFLTIAAVFATTLAASITTIPLIIFHFGTLQNYTLIANLICVPIVELLLLPFAFIAILAMPLGLEWAPLKLAELGAIVLREVSYFINEQPSNITYFSQTNNYFIWLAVFGFLTLFIFKTRIRWVGIPLIIGSYAMLFQPQPKPDFVINEAGTLMMMRSENGYEYFGSKRKSFALYQFISKLGADKITYKERNPACNRNRCEYKNIVFGYELTLQDCKFDYVVNLGEEKIECNHARVIDKQQLFASGSHLFYLNEKRLVTVDDFTKDRPWYKR